jgi:hypothetical protein
MLHPWVRVFKESSRKFLVNTNQLTLILKPMKIAKSASKTMARLFFAWFCIGAAWVAYAGSITNNFTSGADFVANGVVGTMWDGVYLGFGDVPGGNNGGDGNGSALIANEQISGYLTVQSTDSSWAGAGDDGFYLWKIVAGDFDVSVENVPPYDNSPYHFGGLLVRAYTTNGPDWGRPFGANGTNSENWLNITRFNEFSIGDQVRYATNANDIQISAPYNSGTTNYDSETNDTRFFRITRAGDTFSFYDKTNQSDAWVLETNISRPDLHGIPMQVGIEDATFGSAAPVTYWTDFELSGTNVATGVIPPADPSNITLSGTNSATGGITLSWTPGAGSSGSIVAVRANSPLLTQVPNDGYVYTGNTQYGTGDQLASGINVVYAGPNHSVTLAGLGGNNVTYHVAVFSYTGSGSSTIYSTNPARMSFAGTAAVTNIEINLASTNIPIGGVTAASAYADFSTGSRLDISQDPSTGWGTTDTNIAIASPGAFTGVSAGTTMAYVGYAGVTNYFSITVHSGLSFSDGFSTYHDYVEDGVPGSPWDGVYLGATPGGQSGGNVPLCVADIGASDLVTNLMTTNSTTVGAVQSNDVLTIQEDNTAWTGTADNGFLLYKWVSGDFQVAVHITDYTVEGFHFAGLMVRPANMDGTPLGGTEGWIYWDRFDEFGISTLARNDVNASDLQTFNTDGETTDFWLLMSRVNGTNFYFFKKATASGAWLYQPTLTIVRPDLAGVPLQVGLDDATYTPTPLQQVQFDNFMLLDATNLTGLATPPAAPTGMTMTANQDGTITLNWTPSTNGLGSIVVMSADAPVSGQPLPGRTYTGNSVFGQGDNLGNANYVVYVGTGDTVTVSGLAPGTTYYAALYSYAGSGFSTVYTGTSGNQMHRIAEGVVGSVELMPASTTMAKGGILPFTAMAVYTNGVAQNVSTLAGTTITSSPPNAIVATNGVLTALSNGTITVYATFNGVTSTNNPLVTVRNPTFSDNFSVSQNYLANGVTGSGWDGVYEYPSFGIPGTSFSSDGSATTFSADANITSNGVLTVMNENVGWEFNQNDGFFLFKYVPGDFQTAVHISDPLLTTNGTVIAAYNYPGLLARAYGVTNSLLGGPAGGTNGEDWVSWARFDEFGIGTRAEMTTNNATTRSPSSDVGSGQRWLLIVRQNGTGFRFYQRSSATDPWQLAPAGQAYNISQFAGMPMQVGIMEGGFDSGNSVTAQFDHFMLDSTTSGLQLQVMNLGNGTVMLSWPADPNAQLESTGSLNPPNWQPVGGTPTLSPSGYTQSLQTVGATTRFFRLKN